MVQERHRQQRGRLRQGHEVAGAAEERLQHQAQEGSALRPLLAGDKQRVDLQGLLKAEEATAREEGDDLPRETLLVKRRHIQHTNMIFLFEKEMILCIILM